MRINDAGIDTTAIVDLIIPESKYKRNLIHLFKAEVKKEAFRIVSQQNKKVHGNRLLYVNDVLELVCEILDVTPEQLKSKNRSREFVEARQIFSHLLMRVSNYKVSFELVGSFIGKDHATIIYSVNEAEKLMIWNKLFLKKYNACLKAFKTKHDIVDSYINEYNNIPQL